MRWACIRASSWRNEKGRQLEAASGTRLDFCHYGLMSQRAEKCRKRALECERKAVLATEQTARNTFQDLALQWRMMAQEAEELERRRDDAQKAPLPNSKGTTGS
jgi:hypothetical protein